jgi:hypothetical protein
VPYHALRQRKIRDITLLQQHRVPASVHGVINSDALPARIGAPASWSTAARITAVVGTPGLVGMCLLPPARLIGPANRGRRRWAAGQAECLLRERWGTSQAGRPQRNADDNEGSAGRLAQLGCVSAPVMRDVRSSIPVSARQTSAHRYCRRSSGSPRAGREAMNRLPSCRIIMRTLPSSGIRATLLAARIDVDCLGTRPVSPLSRAAGRLLCAPMGALS